MCLACAVPVRGRVLGSECLAAELGPDAPAPKLPERDPTANAHRVVRAAFGVAVVATLVPWSRFGAGSAPFGAWTAAPRWATLAAAAAVIGLVLSLAGRWWGVAAGIRDLATAVAGGLVAIASALAIARPPAFTSPWLGPWMAIAAGAIAMTASLVARNRARVHVPAHV
jgi:hypothetical protein